VPPRVPEQPRVGSGQLRPAVAERSGSDSRVRQQHRAHLHPAWWLSAAVTATATDTVRTCRSATSNGTSPFDNGVSPAERIGIPRCLLSVTAVLLSLSNALAVL